MKTLKNGHNLDGAKAEFGKFPDENAHASPKARGNND